MIEADLENLGGGRVARDMSAEFAVSRVRAHDHRQRIPANDRRDAGLHLDVARKCPLLLQRNGVSVWSEGQYVGYDAELLGLAVKRGQNELRALGAPDANDGFERLEPFGSLRWVAVGPRG